MVLENKLGITNSSELAREEERISKKRAIELFETDFLGSLKADTYSSLAEIHRRDIYMKGIDTSYYYEGYTALEIKDLG